MSEQGETTSWAGGAFHESLPSGKARGRLHLDARGVRLESHEGEELIALPFRGLLLSRGGASDRLVFFRHPDHPGWSLHTAERDVLDHPHLGVDPHLAAQVSDLRKQRTRSRAVTLALLGVIAGALFGLFALKDPIVGLVVDQIPPSWEIALGDQIFDQLSKGRTLVDDPAALEELELLVAPLLEALGDSPYDFRFHIVEDASINAFAIPGGHVTLHTGLIESAESPEEILGVLAHEIIHVTRKHSLRQLVGTAGVFLLIQTLLGDLSGLAAVLVENGSFLLGQKFSRDHEREADDLGLDLLIRARIDPRGMVTFFEKLRKQTEELEKIEQPLSLVSTHPATSERIAHLERRIEELEFSGEFRKFDISLETLRGQPGDSARQPEPAPSGAE